jgi:hypothetical protein
MWVLESSEEKTSRKVCPVLLNAADGRKMNIIFYDL